MKILRKTGILAILLAVPVMLATAAPVQAIPGISVIESSATAHFPTGLTFDLTAESGTEITDIRLHYRTERLSFARITSEIYVEFVPASTVEASWTWDMRTTGGLPPGTGVSYWWTITDKSGERLESPVTTISFDDDRYDWETIIEGNITLKWYNGDSSFARELMTAAGEALQRLRENTGAHLKKPITVYIYANSADLQGAMIFPQEWTGGTAFTSFGIITAGISPSSVIWGKSTIAHELTHLVNYQMTANPYNYLPTWLEEGLAMYSEGALGVGFSTRLFNAIRDGNLITVRTLASPFSTDESTAYLSYAQSYSIVEFLVGSYGQEKMLELLNVFSRGSEYDSALRAVYGFDMDGLNELWLNYIEDTYGEATN